MARTKGETNSPAKKSKKVKSAKKASEKASKKASPGTGPNEVFKGPVISRLVHYHSAYSGMRVSENARARLREVGNNILATLGRDISRVLEQGKKVVVKHSAVKLVAGMHGLSTPAKDTLSKVKVIKTKEGTALNQSSAFSCLATATFKRAAKAAIGQLAKDKSAELGDEGVYALRAVVERCVADVIELASKFAHQAKRATLSQSDVDMAVSSVCNPLVNSRN